MKFTAHNIRSIAKADMTIDGITLVLGQNQSGKTTLLNTVAACMLGERNLYGATAKDASPVLRTGEEVASAQVYDGEDEKYWNSGLVWPAYDHGVHGPMPPSNEITMGRVDPAGDFNAKDWAAFVRQISGAGKIKPGEVHGRLKDKVTGHWPTEDGAKAADGLMGLLKQGWDVAAKHAEGKRTEARRRWEKITGDRFGTIKADGWVAEGTGDAGVNLDEMIDFWEQETTKLEEAARRADVKAEVLDVSIPELKADIKTRTEESQGLGKVIKTLQDQANRVVEDLKAYPEGDEMECPHCSGVLIMIAGKLVEVGGGKRKGSTEHKALLQEHQEVQTALTARIQERGKVVAALEADQALLRKMQNAVS